MKVCGAPFCPESHKLSAVQLVVQLPEVVEWKPLTQFHTTVVLTGIVGVLVPLTVSTNFVPPWPTLTVAVAGSEPFTRELGSAPARAEPGSWYPQLRSRSREAASSMFPNRCH